VGKHKKAARAASLEHEILDAWIRPEPERHYYTAIRRAFIQRFAGWYLSPSNEERLEKEWTILASQLFHHPPTMPTREWSKLPTQPRIIRVLRHALRATADYRRKGRPIGDKRRVAALALDLQNSDPKRWSWRSLTNYLCNCGLKEHPPNSNCQKDLRRETVWLKDWLRTQGIKVPQRINR
jgi:hypothetical protein